jgi:hypothetical protein
MRALCWLGIHVWTHSICGGFGGMRRKTCHRCGAERTLPEEG